MLAFFGTMSGRLGVARTAGKANDLSAIDMSAQFLTRE